jgi:hypothetical protein
MNKQKDEEEKEEKRDPFDGEYIGNIWGWKFSYLSLIIILVIAALMLVRYFQVYG